MKRNNKGYSLVELVIAVAILLIVMAELGALMVNSQHIYRNGLYEVDLQEEAQQVLQLMGDMMANANVSIDRETYEHNGIKSDKIVIITDVMQLNEDGTPKVVAGVTQYEQDVKYELGLSFDVVPVDTVLPNGHVVKAGTDLGSDQHKYDTIIMKRTSGSDVRLVPLAEGVQSVRLLAQDELAEDGVTVARTFKVGYETANQLTLQVTMQNEQYSYKSSIDVYLRNQIGNGGPPVNSTVISNVNGDLNVRRVHTYVLKDCFPGYKYFKWKDAGDARYDFTSTETEEGLGVGVLKNPTIKAGSAFLSNLGEHCDEVLMLASKSPDMSDAITLRIYTEAVYAPDMPLYNMNTTATGEGAAGMLNTFPIKGICVCSTCTGSHKMRAQITAKMPDGKTIRSTDASINGKKVDRVIAFDSAGGYDCNEEDPGGLDNSQTTIDGAIVTTPRILNHTYASSTGSSISIQTAAAGGNNNCTFVMEDGSEKTYTFLQQCAGEFVYETQVEKDSNSVILQCSTANTTGMGSYWNFVDIFDGYLRVNVELNYGDKCTALPTNDAGDHVLRFNGYYYPSVEYESAGYTNAQHNKLWNFMLGTDTDEEYNYIATAEPQILRANVEATYVGPEDDGLGTKLLVFKIKNTGTAKANAINVSYDMVSSPDGNFIKSVSCVEGGLTAEYGSGKITFKGGELAIDAEITVKISYVEAAPGEIAATHSIGSVDVQLPYGGITYAGQKHGWYTFKNAAGDTYALISYSSGQVSIGTVGQYSIEGTTTYDLSGAAAFLESKGYTGISFVNH